jgi:hypothetical protein
MSIFLLFFFSFTYFTCKPPPFCLYFIMYCVPPFILHTLSLFPLNLLFMYNSALLLLPFQLSIDTYLMWSVQACHFQ